MMETQTDNTDASARADNSAPPWDGETCASCGAVPQVEAHEQNCNAGHYPSPGDLRAQADRLARDQEAISDSSEYPRVARFTVAGQVEALREYAETIESVGTIPAKRPGMSGEERRERRASILRLRAARLKVKASDAQRRSHDIGCRIPFGQPILVGHHSERGHRRAIEKMHNASAAAYSASNYADELERRADHVEARPTIQASDSDAVEQYREKLARLTGHRDNMKAINAAWRRFEKTKDASELNALGLDAAAITLMRDKIAAAYSWEKQPFPGWQITNLGARIRDITAKIERLERAKATPERESELTGGVRFEDSPADNRFRLFFPGKPDQATRTELKRNGFRWTPSLGCWQAFRNWRAEQFIKTLSAQTTNENL